MAYFECIVGNGGGSAVGNTLIVTCNADFAGTTISCSKSGTTYTKTCPSTSPYTVEFNGLEAGTWTVSGSVSGQSYSTTVVIVDNTTTLSAGFDYRSWVTAGGLDPTDYSSLSDVFADEAAVRRLMLVHASADYLIDEVTNDVDTLDAFVANDTAMKWLGLCDYVCDGIVAITGAEAKLLGSTYWERYLKDHVPTMTSNTAPYGSVTGSAVYQSYYLWYAFDGNSNTKYVTTQANGYIQYEFTNPICVKAMLLTDEETYFVKTGTVKGSNDGSTWETIYTFTKNTNVTNELYKFANNDKYYKFIKLENTSSIDTQIYTLQFYGRELSVSVPVMTSNTAPFGEASSSSNYTGRSAYMAFKNITNVGWQAADGQTANWIQYKFIAPMVCKALGVYFNIAGSSNWPYSLQASEDGTTNWQTLKSGNTIPNTNLLLDIDNFEEYKYFKLNITGNMAASASNNILVCALQFYGLDYSEKEFEAGTTKKWLYDHGVRLDTLTPQATNNYASATDDGESLNVKLQGGSNYAALWYTSQDLTNYSRMRAKFGKKVYSSNNEACALCVINSVPTSGTNTRSAYMAYGNGNNDSYLPYNAYLDISSYNETKLIDIEALTGTSINKDASITEWWLEP